MKKLYFLIFMLIAMGVYAAANKVVKVDQININNPSNTVVDVKDTLKLDNQKAIRFAEQTGNGSNYTALTAADAITTNTTFKLPSADGTDGQFLKTNGTGDLSFATVAAGTGATSGAALENLSLTATVGSNQLTVALKTEDGGDPAGGDIVSVGFRSATATSGEYDILQITSALSLVVSSGSTLGTFSGEQADIFIYLINNGGTPLLGVSRRVLDEGKLYTTTAEGGAGGADKDYLLYASSAVSDKAIRLIGRLASTQATAGTWATTPSEVSVWPFRKRRPIINANISGTNPSLGTSNVASYTEIVDGGLTMVRNSGSIPVGIPCSTTNTSAVGALTCSAGSEGLGVVFDVDEDNSNWMICINFTPHTGVQGSSAVIYTTFELVQTAANAQTILQRGKDRTALINNTNQAGSVVFEAHPHKNCGIFNLSKGADVTIRLMYEQQVSGSIGGAEVITDASSAAGDRDVHIYGWRID